MSFAASGGKTCCLPVCLCMSPCFFFFQKKKNNQYNNRGAATAVVVEVGTPQRRDGCAIFCCLTTGLSSGRGKSEPAEMEVILKSVAATTRTNPHEASSPKLQELLKETTVETKNAHAPTASKKAEKTASWPCHTRTGHMEAWQSPTLGSAKNRSVFGAFAKKKKKNIAVVSASARANCNLIHKKTKLERIPRTPACDESQTARTAPALAHPHGAPRRPLLLTAADIARTTMPNDSGVERIRTAKVPRRRQTLRRRGASVAQSSSPSSISEGPTSQAKSATR